MGGYCLFLLGICGLLFGTVPVEAAPGPPEPVWVLLAKKVGEDGREIRWDTPGFRPTAAVLGLPLDGAAIDAIRAAGIPLRFASRWLNAVSVVADARQIQWLHVQPFVRGVRRVRRRYRGEAQDCTRTVVAARLAGEIGEGVAFEQLAQIHVIELHQHGLDGTGVRVALLDNGFEYSGHEAFGTLEVVGTRDFVNGDAVVGDERDQPLTGDETRTQQNIHGAQVLSLIAGYAPGRFSGVAPGAEFLLAKTEDNGSELPIEEDRWIAGLEWADSLGARVVSSSLGYNLWDDGSGYTYAQMDGQSALTSQAAAAAVRRGLVVVVAAGNEGNNDWRHVTAPADADGVICVGSVDIPVPGGRPPVLAATSSRGPTADGRIKPDVVAPGQGVVAADVRQGGYVRVNGTSFAAPLVAGVCALLLQSHPDWGPPEILDALRATAMDLGTPGADNEYGWGQVNALAACGLGSMASDSVTVGVPFPNPVSGDKVYFPLTLNARSQVHLSIFTVSGELIHRDSWWLVPGEYTLPMSAPVWDIAATERVADARLANGLVLYRLRGGGVRESGKIALRRSQRSHP